MPNKKMISFEKAVDIVKMLGNSLEGYRKFHVCGSVRREKRRVGDIDIVIVLNDYETFCRSLEKIVRHVLISGTRKIRVLISNDIQVDFQIVDEEEYGAAVLYMTGSKWFNIRMRSVAKKKGLKLNEYGLWDNNNKRVALSEEEIMTYLGFEKYLDPKTRSK